MIQTGIFLFFIMVVGLCRASTHSGDEEGYDSLGEGGMHPVELRKHYGVLAATLGGDKKEAETFQMLSVEGDERIELIRRWFAEMLRCSRPEIKLEIKETNPIIAPARDFRELESLSMGPQGDGTTAGVFSATTESGSLGGVQTLMPKSILKAVTIVDCNSAQWSASRAEEVSGQAKVSRQVVWSKETKIHEIPAREIQEDDASKTNLKLGQEAAHDRPHEEGDGSKGENSAGEQLEETSKKLHILLYEKEALTEEEKKEREEAYFPQPAASQEQKKKPKKKSTSKSASVIEVPHFSWQDYPEDCIPSTDKDLFFFQAKGILKGLGKRYILKPDFDMGIWFEKEPKAKQVITQVSQLLWNGGTLDKKSFQKATKSIVDRMPISYEDMKFLCTLFQVENPASPDTEKQIDLLSAICELLLRKRSEDVRVEIEGWHY